MQEKVTVKYISSETFVPFLSVVMNVCNFIFAVMLRPAAEVTNCDRCQRLRRLYVHYSPVGHRWHNWYHNNSSRRMYTKLYMTWSRTEIYNPGLWWKELSFFLKLHSFSVFFLDYKSVHSIKMFSYRYLQPSVIVFLCLNVQIYEAIP